MTSFLQNRCLYVRPPVVKSCNFKHLPILESRVRSGRVGQCAASISRGNDFLSYLPWWPSCLDRGALNNVEATGCGTSVVRGPTGHKSEGFHPGVQLCPKVFSPKVPTSRHVHKSLNRVLIKEAILVQE